MSKTFTVIFYNYLILTKFSGSGNAEFQSVINDKIITKQYEVMNTLGDMDYRLVEVDDFFKLDKPKYEEIDIDDCSLKLIAHTGSRYIFEKG